MENNEIIQAKARIAALYERMSEDDATGDEFCDITEILMTLPWSERYAEAQRWEICPVHLCDDATCADEGTLACAFVRRGLEPDPSAIAAIEAWAAADEENAPEITPEMVAAYAAEMGLTEDQVWMLEARLEDRLSGEVLPRSVDDVEGEDPLTEAEAAAWMDAIAEAQVEAILDTATEIVAGDERLAADLGLADADLADQDEVDALEGALVNAEAEMAAQEGRIASAEAQIAALTARIATLEAGEARWVTATKGRIDGLWERLGDSADEAEFENIWVALTEALASLPEPHRTTESQRCGICPVHLCDAEICADDQVAECAHLREA